MKNILLIFLFITTTSFAQSKFKLITTIDTEADFFTSDNQSNVYVVKGNELKKYNKAGKLLYKYSNKTLGNIDFIDASNMLRLLVFYKNFLQIVFLDNTLSLSGEPISLDKIEFQQAQLACSSYNSCTWLYDQQNIELVRINQDFEKIVGTGNLSMLLNMSIQPNYLVEHDNKIYLNNPSTGILIFDIYGTYFKTIPIKNLQSFQPIADRIYFTAEKKIKSYNLKTTEEIEFEIPEFDFKNFRLENDVLILQNSKSVQLYSAQ
jgi:hypothetical protein